MNCPRLTYEVRNYSSRDEFLRQSTAYTNLYSRCHVNAGGGDIFEGRFAAENFIAELRPPLLMDGRHPERPPRRSAQPISSADSGEHSVAARRSWAAPGLSSGRFVVAAAANYSV